MHFYSGQTMHFYSGVDTWSKSRDVSERERFTKRNVPIGSLGVDVVELTQRPPTRIDDPIEPLRKFARVLPRRPFQVGFAKYPRVPDAEALSFGHDQSQLTFVATCT